MSESNNNIPMRITQLPEATSYTDGMYYAVASASGGTKKISASALTPFEKNIFQIQDNFFSQITKGYFIDGNGNRIANDNYFYTNNVECAKGEEWSFSYSVNGTRYKSTGAVVSFYDANGNAVSGGYSLSTTSGKITIPDDDSIKSFILSQQYSDLYLDLMIHRGNYITPYIAPYYSINENVLVQYKSIIESVVLALKENKIDYINNQNVFGIPLKFTPKNLFDFNAVIDGKYVDWQTGGLANNSYYCASEYIPIIPNQKITQSGTEQFAFYDKNKVYCQGVPSGSHTATIPPNAQYIRVCLNKNNLHTFQLEYGESVTAYQNHYKNFTYNDIMNGYDTLQTSIPSIMSKLVESSSSIKVKLIGDSITAGFGGTGYNTNGEQIGSSIYHANDDGYCWANNLKDYYEKKFDCTVKNWGISGFSSGNLKSAISWLVENDDDIIVAMIGTNNRQYNNGMTELYDDLIYIINYVRNLGKEIIIMSSIPASISNEAEKPHHMEEVDYYILKASNDSGIPYISLYKKFIEYCKYTGTTIDSYLVDGLHPNDTGYDVLFYLITNALGIGNERDGATW